MRRNPAGLTLLEGRQLELSGGMADIVFEAEFHAPEDCAIFGFDCAENDPVVGQRSRTSSLGLFVPGFGLIGMPEGPSPAPLGAGFSVQPPGSKLTFGNAMFLENVAGYYRDAEDDPGRYQAQGAAIQRFTYFAPTVAYQVTDSFSVGAGIHFSHQGFAANLSTRAPNMLLGVGQRLQDAFGCDEQQQEPLAPWLALCGGKIGPWEDIGDLNFSMQETLSTSFTVGVLWRPNDWFSWGANYSSGDRMNLKGTFELDYTEDWAGFWQSVNSSVLGAIGAAILSLPSGVPYESGNISSKQEYPQHFSTGVSVRVLPFLTLNADVDYVNLGSQQSLVLDFDRELEFLNAARILSPDKAAPSQLKIDQSFEDVWNLGFGATYHATDRLDLRAGVQFRDDAIPDDKKTIMFPIGELTMYGLGFGYRWSENTVIDASISYMRSRDNMPANSTCNMNCDNITNIVYNPYAGLDVTQQATIRQAGLAFRTKF
ncbi:MAG: aromatic hydrocarbon degradation protein [Halomonadaceae bacterium]|nr:MAG: aromatic hydrocarbon degradation protein [Halomonadaceae bacterium]